MTSQARSLRHVTCRALTRVTVLVTWPASVGWWDTAAESSTGEQVENLGRSEIKVARHIFGTYVFFWAKIKTGVNSSHRTARFVNTHVRLIKIMPICRPCCQRCSFQHRGQRRRVAVPAVVLKQAAEPVADTPSESIWTRSPLIWCVDCEKKI